MDHPEVGDCVDVDLDAYAQDEAARIERMGRCVARFGLQLFLVLLCLMVAGTAFASQCTQYKLAMSSHPGYESAWSTSPQAAGNDLASKLPKTYSWSDIPCTNGSWSVVSASTNWVAMRMTRPGCTNSIGVFGGTGADDYGGVPSARTGDYCNQCGQLQGLEPNNLTCTGQRCAFYMANTPSSPIFMCDTMGDKSTGCMLTGSLNFAAWDSQEQKWATYTHTNTYTGMECTVSDSTPGTGTVTNSNPPGTTDTVPTPPPEGQCPGEVNGQTVLVPCDRTMTPGRRTTTTFEVTPDGSTRQTTTTTSDNTTCVNGVCTTQWTNTVTVTVTPSGGGPGTTTQTRTTGTATESLSDYCEDHPQAQACLDSVFSGSCQGGFTCNGDAATCAIAKAVNHAKCYLDPGTAIDAVKTQLAEGTFGASLPTSAKSVGLFDQSNPVSSTCPGDHTLTLGGLSVAIPLSQACSYLQLMGNLLVAFTLLAATVYVVKGFGG